MFFDDLLQFSLLYTYISYDYLLWIENPDHNLQAEKIRIRISLSVTEIFTFKVTIKSALFGILARSVNWRGPLLLTMAMM